MPKLLTCGNPQVEPVGIHSRRVVPFFDIIEMPPQRSVRVSNILYGEGGYGIDVGPQHIVLGIMNQPS
jgi:hypothetical protein